ncbi:hypothetical protein NP493_640g03039 [Ridgeia piscesae]|uniref:Succinate--CoA ligase [GDP-forming] subunit beta, mitochondrial n=1 Tax=Ridgeia piscesae TaxID=27915 RepID=A0AAD9KSP7_RIDPI|nr:hypothetical protein NP493_640g03039 [Ridgeia piscesae]
MAALSRNVTLAARKHLLKQVRTCSEPVRCLNLQEFQSKKLMADNGIAVQRFQVAQTLKDAENISKNFNVREYVIKAQILAGGRGKGVFDTGFKGGVHLTKEPEKVSDIVADMLGNKLITKQTPKGGVKVNTVMVAEALDIERETYFAILIDRTYGGPVLIGSPQGGMDIEEVAESSPDAIFKQPIDIMTGLREEQVTDLVKNLGFTGDKASLAATQIKKLYELFLKVDATQIEINPFAETPDGQVVCFDAKINFDDNAEFRHKDIFALDDESESDPREVEAARLNLNYIGMDGNIGCLVNGAGLAMATMDLVQLQGGRPANFLDVGGGVTETQVCSAFKILTSDSQVKVILVNVFGGIVNCATIASGIIEACRITSLDLPVVVRLEGSNVDKARQLLADSGLPIVTAGSFEDAAIKAVECLKAEKTRQVA